MSEPFKGTINIDIRYSVSGCTPFESPTAREGSPNVIYMVLDDVGFSVMGCYGGPIETPHIDRVAADGVRCTQYDTALCSPARSWLLTGSGNRPWAREKETRTVPPETELPPGNLIGTPNTQTGPVGQPGPITDFTRPRDSLPEVEKRLFRLMTEVYAGFLAHADRHIGRLLDYLEASNGDQHLGQLERRRRETGGGGVRRTDRVGWRAAHRARGGLRQRRHLVVREADPDPG